MGLILLMFLQNLAAVCMQEEPSAPTHSTITYLLFNKCSSHFVAIKKIKMHISRHFWGPPLPWGPASSATPLDIVHRLHCLNKNPVCVVQFGRIPNAIVACSPCVADIFFTIFMRRF